MDNHDAWARAQVGTPTPVDARPGGFGIRFAARFIDALIGLLIGFAGGFVGAVLVALTRGPQAVAASRNVLGSPHAIEAIVVSLLASACGVSTYHVTCEWLGGATLGKLVVGLCVRNAQLGRCTFGSALIRTLAYNLDGLFFGLVACLVMQESEMKQRLGDRGMKRGGRDLL